MGRRLSEVLSVLEERAPLALAGARLGDVEIKKSILRGVESNGMLCSARELRLSEDHSGLLEIPHGKIGHDVYKALEAMAYSIATQKDSALEATADRIVDLFDGKDDHDA